MEAIGQINWLARRPSLFGVREDAIKPARDVRMFAASPSLVTRSIRAQMPS